MPKIFLIAEADSEVGFGHLSEVRALAMALEKLGGSLEVVGIGPVPAYEGWRLGRWMENVESALTFVASKAPSVSLWSLRRPLSPRAVDILQRMRGAKVWLTDQPSSIPPIDLLVLPTVVEQWCYKPQEVNSALLGSTYFPLDPVYASVPLPFEKRDGDVVLTLGGADPTQATLRLLPAVAGLHSTVVIGPGFRHRDQVREAAALMGIKWCEAPETLYPFLRNHRLVISSGGNTLYEAAASGTPAFVAWEDPHEEKLALAFARAGAVSVLGQGSTVGIRIVRDTIVEAAGSGDILSRMAKAGRRLVDGKGAWRIAEAVWALASQDRSILYPT